MASVAFIKNLDSVGPRVPGQPVRTFVNGDGSTQRERPAWAAGGCWVMFGNYETMIGYESQEDALAQADEINRQNTLRAEHCRRLFPENTWDPYAPENN